MLGKGILESAKEIPAFRGGVPLCLCMSSCPVHFSCYTARSNNSGRDSVMCVFSKGIPIEFNGSYSQVKVHRIAATEHNLLQGQVVIEVPVWAWLSSERWPNLLPHQRAGAAHAEVWRATPSKPVRFGFIGV